MSPTTPGGAVSDDVRARIRARAQRLADEAPPLRAEQRARLAAVLRPRRAES